VAQSVKRQTLGFGTCHDLRGLGIQAQVSIWALCSAGSLLKDSIPLPLPSLAHALSFFFKQIILKKKVNETLKIYFKKENVFRHCNHLRLNLFYKKS